MHFKVVVRNLRVLNERRWLVSCIEACHSGALRTGSMAFEATLWQNLDQLYAE